MLESFYCIVYGIVGFEQQAGGKYTSGAIY